MGIQIILLRNQEQLIMTGAAASIVQIAAHDVIRFEGIDFDAATVKIEGHDLVVMTPDEGGASSEIRLKDFIDAHTGAPAADVIGDDKASADILQAISPAAGGLFPEHSQRIGYVGVYDYVYNNLALEGPPHDFGNGDGGDEEIVGATSRLTDVPGFYGADGSGGPGGPPPLSLINLDGNALNFRNLLLVGGFRSGTLDQAESGDPAAPADGTIVGGRSGALITEMTVEITGGFRAGDSLTVLGDTSGFTLSPFDPVTHRLTITGTGTFEQYDEFIRTLQLDAVNSVGAVQPRRTIEISITDDGVVPETATATVYGAEPVFSNGDDRRDFNDPNFIGDDYSPGSQFIGGQGGDSLVLPNDLDSGMRSGYTDSLGNPLAAIYGDSGNNGPYDPSISTGDSIEGGIFNDTIYGESGQDEIFGAGGNDVLYGGTERDTLEGGAGADTIYGGTGGEIGVIGGGDIAFYTNDNSSMTINLNDNSQNHGGEAEGDALFEIEEIDAGNGNNFLTGNAHRSTEINSGTGANTLVGGDQDDYLFSFGAGSSLLGGDGADTITGAGFVDGGNGDDLINGGGIVYGGAGADTINGSGEIYGGTGNDSITTGGSDDRIDGGAGDDFISSGAGADTISGGVDGIDQLNGGVGDDLLITNGAFGPGSAPGLGAQLFGGTGNDTLQLLQNADIDLRPTFETAFQDIETIDLIAGGNHTVTLDFLTLMQDLPAAGGTLRILADAGDALHLSTASGGAWSSAAGAGNTTIWTNSTNANYHVQIDDAAATNPVP